MFLINTLFELNDLNKYFKIIGSGDKDTQIEYLNAVSAQLSNKCVICEEEEKKYRSLYVKLGFLIGLIALIILL